MNIRVFITSAALFLSSTGVWGQAVLPGQLFAGKLLTVRAPNTDGWRMLPPTNGAMSFAHGGVSSTDSYIATAALFPLEKSNSREEFLSLIKRGVEADTPSDRFRNVELQFDFTDSRGYDCARVKMKAEDINARVSSSSTAPLQLQSISLYCKHPSLANAGFVASFSYRATAFDPELEWKAHSFIEGVQVD